MGEKVSLQLHFLVKSELRDLYAAWRKQEIRMFGVKSSARQRSTGEVATKEKENKYRVDPKINCLLLQ